MVDRSDVTEAMRLIEASKSSINQDADPSQRSQSRVNKIYNLIKEMADQSKSREVELSEAIQRCQTLGFSSEEIDEAIDNYEDANMWQVNQARTKIIFV